MDRRRDNFVSLYDRKVSDWALFRHEWRDFDIWSSRFFDHDITVGLLFVSNIFSRSGVHAHLCKGLWIGSAAFGQCGKNFYRSCSVREGITCRLRRRSDDPVRWSNYSHYVGSWRRTPWLKPTANVRNAPKARLS